MGTEAGVDVTDEADAETDVADDDEEEGADVEGTEAGAEDEEEEDRAAVELALYAAISRA